MKRGPQAPMMIGAKLYEALVRTGTQLAPSGPADRGTHRASAKTRRRRRAVRAARRRNR